MPPLYHGGFSFIGDDRAPCLPTPCLHLDDLLSGELTQYNGVDVTQSQHYIKLSNKTYFDKVTEEHAWLQQDTDISNKPLPLFSDKQFNHLLEHTVLGTVNPIRSTTLHYLHIYTRNLRTTLMSPKIKSLPKT